MKAENHADVAGADGVTGGDDTPVDRAIAAFRDGQPVLVHDFDDREAETDLLFPAEAVEPADVARLRNDAGGLVFVALPAGVADAFDLPFLHDALDHPATEYDDVGYDSRPSFSLSVNHRDTYTGITDVDRAKTIVALADAAGSPTETDFAETFRAPGHVHVLRGAAGLLGGRRGHTELGLALAAAAREGRGASEREDGEAASPAPAVAGAEMLDDETGRALSTADARAYAELHGLVFVEGDALIERLG